MADTKENATLDYTHAVESLLFKLTLSQTLVGEEREIEKGRLSQEFGMSSNFSNRDSEHNEGHICVISAKDYCHAYACHSRFSKHSTVLCALACHALSKSSGIGSVLMIWKDNKKFLTLSRN